MLLPRRVRLWSSRPPASRRAAAWLTAARTACVTPFWRRCAGATSGAWRQRASVVRLARERHTSRHIRTLRLRPRRAPGRSRHRFRPRQRRAGRCRRRIGFGAPPASMLGHRPLPTDRPPGTAARFAGSDIGSSLCGQLEGRAGHGWSFRGDECSSLRQKSPRVVRLQRGGGAGGAPRGGSGAAAAGGGGGAPRGGGGGGGRATAGGPPAPGRSG